MPSILQRTERLVLRQWRQSDFESFAAFHGDPELARFVGGCLDRDAAWRRMAPLVGHWVLHGFGYWAVDERSSGRFVGGVGLWRSAGWPELELGYWVVPAMRRNGYATEAARRAVQHAYSVVGADTLVSYIHPENEPSMRVAERLGAEYEATIELLEHGPHRVYRYPKPPQRWVLAAWR